MQLPLISKAVCIVLLLCVVADAGIDIHKNVKKLHALAKVPKLAKRQDSCPTEDDLSDECEIALNGI